MWTDACPGHLAEGNSGAPARDQDGRGCFRLAVFHAGQRAALRPPSLVTSVAEGLVDDDPQIRELAIEILRGYDREERATHWLLKEEHWTIAMSRVCGSLMHWQS